MTSSAAPLVNPVCMILEEIALEGLDGITMDDLINRLSVVSKAPVKNKQYVWQVITKQMHIDVYTLPEARPSAPSLPFVVVEDKEVKGSCSTYHTRVNVTSEAKSLRDYDELISKTADGVERRLVFVASQKLREREVCKPNRSQDILDDLSSMQYALLERIARARRAGETSVGEGSLQEEVGVDSKTLFYLRKLLLKKNLITKQDYVYKENEKKNIKGCVLHLKRFSVEQRSRAQCLVSLLTNAARSKAESRGGRAILTMEDIKKETSITSEACKRLMKHTALQRDFVETRVPYTLAYPHEPCVKDEEWSETKSRPRKKMRSSDQEIRVIELKSDESTSERAQGSEESINDEDGFNTEEVDNNEDECASMFLAVHKLHPLKTYMRQGYEALLEAGSNGMTQLELGDKLGLSRLESRQLTKNLSRRSHVTVHFRDVGRQRVAVFVISKTCSDTEGQGIPTDMEKAMGQFKAMVAQSTSKEEDSELATSLSEATCAEHSTLEESVILDVVTTTTSAATTADDKMEVDVTCTSTGEEEPNARSPLAPTPVKMTDAMVDSNDQTEVLEEIEQKPSDVQVAMLHSSVIATKLSPKKRKTEVKGESRSLRVSESMSLKQLNRVNLILEEVKTDRVVSPVRLQKKIERMEAAKGYEEKMDKKSLMRQLSRLEASNHLKNICVKLKLDSKEKQLHFICDNSVSKSDTLITSAIEEAKMKLSIEQEAKTSTSESTAMESWRSSSMELQEMLNDTANTETPDKQSEKSKFIKGQGRSYGLQPKFVRMQELHILLVFLSRHQETTYDGESKRDDLIELLLSNIHDNNEQEVSKDQLRSELSAMQIFQHGDINGISSDSSGPIQVDWRLFIPPLPKHEGWPSGWCLLSDVLLRLPLSLYVRLVNVTNEVDHLDSYLSHPIRKHYLIKALPISMRRMLLKQRKYVFKVYEIVTQLAFIGLVQVSHVASKEKEQMFVYVNDQTSLLNTATATPSNDIITLKDERESFQRVHYQIRSCHEAELFWVALRDICLLTPLSNSASNPEENNAIRCDKKPELMEALKPVKADEAPSNDNGLLPGDNAGAAGLDSSLFAHVKRNWSWLPRAPASTRSKTTTVFMSGKKAISARVERRAQRGGSSVERYGRSSRSRPEASSSATKAMPDERPPSTESGPPDKNLKKAKKPFYDAKDKEALQLMTKLRVDWSDREDSFLLLCKVAALYLAKRSKSTERYHMLPHLSVRDLLHRHFDESSNKTSRACQRRINYMMRNKVTEQNVKLVLADVLRDVELEQLCKDIEEQQIQSEGSTSLAKDEQIRLLFEPVVQRLMDKYNSERDQKTTMTELLNNRKFTIPDSVEELNKKFDVATASETCEEEVMSELSISDMEASVVESLILSSLCTASDKTSRSFLLYKLYQQYPDSLLRSVMNHLRSSRMVSLKKSYHTKRAAQQRPHDVSALSASPYQLSVTFAHTLLGRYQYDLYSETWKAFKDLLCDSYVAERPSDFISDARGGSVAVLVSLMVEDKVKFRTNVPEQLVVLDPNLASIIGNKDESQHLEKIVKRYKSLLRLSGHVDAKDLLAITKDESERHATASTATRTKSIDATDLPPSSIVQSEDEPQFKRRKLYETTTSKDFAADEMILERSTPSSSSTSSSLQPVRSRVALHLMREELQPSTTTSKSSVLASSKVQHAYDFFVIASCKINVKLANAQKATEDEEQEMIWVGNDTSIRFQAPNGLLPFSMHIMSNIMAKFGLGATGLANNAVDKLKETILLPRSELNVSETKDRKEEDSDKDRKRESVLETLLESIRLRKEQGMSCNELKQSTEKFEIEEVVMKMEELMKNQRVIRVGVGQPRFVAREYSRPWLLHSFRVTRTKTLEKLDTSSQTSTTSSTSSVDWSKLEQLDVKLRPWIRIDGTLNRRVLDRLLGAVLNFVMEHPAQSMDRVGRRFKPALQPMHTRELLELLFNIGAVTFVTVYEDEHQDDSVNASPVFASPPTLRLLRSSWSRPSPSFLLEESCDVLVEAEADAVLKLAQFIGDKRYNLDFSCQCTCHPERI